MSNITIFLLFAAVIFILLSIYYLHKEIQEIQVFLPELVKKQDSSYNNLSGRIDYYSNEINRSRGRISNIEKMIPTKGHTLYSLCEGCKQYIVRDGIQTCSCGLTSDKLEGKKYTAKAVIKYDIEYVENTYNCKRCC